MRRKYFIAGLIIIYIGMGIATGWKLYFLSYLIGGVLIYLDRRDLLQTLYLISIVSLPYSVGPFQTRTFLSDTPFISSYGLFPFTISTVILSFFLFLKPILFRVKKPDVLLILFFLYIVLGFVFNPTNTSFLYGIFQFAVFILFYFNSRSLLADKKILNYIFITLISIILFESSLAVIQFLLQRPIGLFSEEFLNDKPYGIISPENIELFRASGTLSHPNYLANLLVSILPIFFIYGNKVLKVKKHLFVVLNCLIILALIFTFSRTNWILFLVYLGYLLYQHRSKTNIRINYAHLLFSIILFIFLLFSMYPFISNRLSSIPTALSDFGSIGLRLKVIQIASYIISENPVFGIGLNQFLNIAPDFTEEHIFSSSVLSSSTLVHNIFVQIATDTGILGLFIFLAFIIFVLKEFYSDKQKRRNVIIQSSVIGFLFFLGGGMFNPFFLRVLMRLFFLFAAIIVS